MDDKKEQIRECLSRIDLEVSVLFKSDQVNFLCLYHIRNEIKEIEHILKYMKERRCANERKNHL